MILVGFVIGIVVIPCILWKLIEGTGTGAREDFTAIVFAIVGCAASAFAFWIPMSGFLEAQVRSRISRIRTQLSPHFNPPYKAFLLEIDPKQRRP